MVQFLTSKEPNEEIKLPFWKRIYKIGGQEVKLKQEYIELRLEKAAYQCFENDEAYQEFKKRKLFPLGKVQLEVIPHATYT